MPSVFKQPAITFQNCSTNTFLCLLKDCGLFIPSYRLLHKKVHNDLYIDFKHYLQPHVLSNELTTFNSSKVSKYNK